MKNWSDTTTPTSVYFRTQIDIFLPPTENPAYLVMFTATRIYSARLVVCTRFFFNAIFVAYSDVVSLRLSIGTAWYKVLVSYGFKLLHAW